MRKVVASIVFGAVLVTMMGCGSSSPGAQAPSPAGGERPVAKGERIEHKAARVAITVPAGWKKKQDGDVLTVMDPNEDVAAAFSVVDESALGEVTNSIGQNLGARIQNLHFGKQDEIEINGMKGVAIDGDGQMDGVNVDLMVVVIDTPAPGKAMMILALAEDAKLERHRRELKALFQSITPL